MPAPIPGQQIAPGVAGGNTFPQYGVGGGKPGSSAGWKTVTATNGAEKMADIARGYFVWFSSQSAAQNFIGEESSPLGSGGGSVGNPLAGINAIGDFFQRLTQKATWERVAEFAAGALILYIGLKALTAPEGRNVASRTAAQTGRKVLEKVTPQGRTIAAARKVKP